MTSVHSYVLRKARSLWVLSSALLCLLVRPLQLWKGTFCFKRTWIVTICNWVIKNSCAELWGLVHERSISCAHDNTYFPSVLANHWCVFCKSQTQNYSNLDYCIFLLTREHVCCLRCRCWRSGCLFSSGKHRKHCGGKENISIIQAKLQVVEVRSPGCLAFPVISCLSLIDLLVGVKDKNSCFSLCLLSISTPACTNLAPDKALL